MCKDEILEIIESGMTANRIDSFCTCIYPAGEVGRCNYCKVAMALQEARTCIITSAVNEVYFKNGLRRVQAEIEEKLSRLLAKEGD